MASFGARSKWGDNPTISLTGYGCRIVPYLPNVTVYIISANRYIPRRFFRNLLANLRKQVLLIGLAVAAIAGLVGGIIAKRAMHPLATLTKSVETVAVTQDLSNGSSSE